MDGDAENPIESILKQDRNKIKPKALSKNKYAVLCKGVGHQIFEGNDIVHIFNKLICYSLDISYIMVSRRESHGTVEDTCG